MPWPTYRKKWKQSGFFHNKWQQFSTADNRSAQFHNRYCRQDQGLDLFAPSTGFNWNGVLSQQTNCLWQRPLSLLPFSLLAIEQPGWVVNFNDAKCVLGNRQSYIHCCNMDELGKERGNYIMWQCSGRQNSHRQMPSLTCWKEFSMGTLVHQHNPNSLMNLWAR